MIVILVFIRFIGIGFGGDLGRDKQGFIGIISDGDGLGVMGGGYGLGIIVRGCRLGVRIWSYGGDYGVGVVGGISWVYRKFVEEIFEFV